MAVEHDAAAGEKKGLTQQRYLVTFEPDRLSRGAVIRVPEDISSQ